MSRILPLLAVSALCIAPFTVFADEIERAQPWQWMVGVHSNYQYTLRNPESVATPLIYRMQVINGSGAEGVVVLSEQAYLFDPESPLRKRIYQFIERRQGWVQHIFELDPELTETQLEDPEFWQPLHGCSIQWTQTGDHFVGSNNPRHCYFLLEETAQRVAVASEVSLFPDYFLLEDSFAVSDEDGDTAAEEHVHTEYQRTTFYDVQASYSALNNDQWEPASISADLHDQGFRTGLVLQDSGLELRYQIELKRELGKVKFMLHDISRNSVIHEEVFAHDVETIEYSSDRLQLRIKPRP